MDEERRRYKRVDFISDIRIISGQMFVPGKSLNISASGMLIKSEKSFDTSTVINIKIMDPKSVNFFEFNAEIVRTERIERKNTYHTAVQYLSINTIMRNKIERSFCGP